MKIQTEYIIKYTLNLTNRISSGQIQVLDTHVKVSIEYDTAAKESIKDVEKKLEELKNYYADKHSEKRIVNDYRIVKTEIYANSHIKQVW